MVVEVSLLKGWLPVALEIVAVVVLLFAIGWRDARWRTRRLPIVVVGTALSGVLVVKVIAPAVGMTDPLPVRVWIWLSGAFGALVLLGVGWSSAHWGRRLAAVLAFVLAAVVGVNGINQFVGYYPTVGAAVAGLQGQQPPGQVSLAQIKDNKDPAGARSGELVGVTIPAVPSGFAHRQELVYLPPVWFHGPRHPVLPVVEMIGAERSKPENWVRIGSAVKTAQAYAAHHHGLGPILVFVDATAAFSNDTECVNGPHGQAEDHLYRDIPAYITSTFGASKNPKAWAVAGFSMGGTCAIGLTTEHSTAFGHFVDISGDLFPNTGDKAQTIANLFGGSAAAYAAHDPLTVIAKHGRFPALTGRYLDGTEEKLHAREATLLITAGKKQGIASKLTVLPGTHNWQFAESAFSYIFPWLCAQLGLERTTTS
ncbi:esterase family protein [Kribbella qitaiheensis]|uniref:Esterase family protein n=1 Tax=Kribbella qitaiheensis TaxID=1544730 RepID=A0A7G6WS01_9ACTN|nr:alpha/beta hydrolase-fold protein [Kribbella qitaiheensis]QNE16766.1 esterase family protein [Kribbella qitaiheensis]